MNGEFVFLSVSLFIISCFFHFLLTFCFHLFTCLDFIMKSISLFMSSYLGHLYNFSSSLFFYSHYSSLISFLSILTCLNFFIPIYFSPFFFNVLSNGSILSYPVSSNRFLWNIPHRYLSQKVPQTPIFYTPFWCPFLPRMV